MMDDGWPEPLDFSKPLPTNRELAADLAAAAAQILERHPDRVDSATWRLADALALLSVEGEDLPGVHEPTGMGAQIRLHDPKRVG